jgi:Ca2+-binding EF-hand superfamily protein
MPQRLRKFVLASTCVIAASTAAYVLAASPEKVNAGLGEVTQLLKLMDTDKNGKVSKEEFMNFMSAEFDRLDVNKDGELDVKELSQLHMRPPPPASVIHK